MQRSFPLDTAGQRFMEELYNKETGSRLKWQSKTKNDTEGSEQAVSRQYEVFRKKIEAGCPKPTEALLLLKERHQPVSHHKRIRNYDDCYKVQPTMTKDEQIDMFPPEPEIRDQLYEGISREGKGRQLYLRSRNAPSPDRKYRLPVVSSWEYGWNMSDMVKREDVKKPDFGRKKLLNDTFYARNGITTLQVPATQ